jgi:hypothetical protein
MAVSLTGLAARGLDGTLRKVKKTSIYLEPELDLALARRAATVGVSKAELIREALRVAVGGSTQPRLRAIGVGSGPGWVSSDVDRALQESGFGA